MEKNLVKTANQTRFFQENKTLFSCFLYLVILLIINIFVVSFRGLALEPTLSVSLNKSELNYDFYNFDVLNKSIRSNDAAITVGTDAPAGYTTTISADSEETALKHADNTIGSQISSISSPISSDNTIPEGSWAYQMTGQNNYLPIPKKSDPKNIIVTNKKSDPVPEGKNLKVIVRASDNLISGTYRNSLIFSTVANPFETAAYLTTGDNFQAKLSELITDKTKIENILRRSALPAASTKVVSIHDPAKPFYEIKAWWDPIPRAVCFYTAADKIYFHEDSKNTLRICPDLNLLN